MTNRKISFFKFQYDYALICIKDSTDVIKEYKTGRRLRQAVLSDISDQLNTGVIWVILFAFICVIIACCSEVWIVVKYTRGMTRNWLYGLNLGKDIH